MANAGNKKQTYPAGCQICLRNYRTAVSLFMFTVSIHTRIRIRSLRSLSFPACHSVRMPYC